VQTSRVKAAASGDKTYTGKDCKYKHGGVRYTANGVCIKCNAMGLRHYRAKIADLLKIQTTPTPRTAAASRGAVHYVGKECGNGHNGLRYTSTGDCVQCQAERTFAYKMKMREALDEARAANKQAAD